MHIYEDGGFSTKQEHLQQIHRKKTKCSVKYQFISHTRWYYQYQTSRETTGLLR